jgi:ankyrin repeat protein
VEVVTFLLSQRGVKTNLGTETNWTPLHVACDNPDPKKKYKLMSLLLSQKGTNPNIQNRAGTSPLPPLCMQLMKKFNLIFTYY